MARHVPPHNDRKEASIAMHGFLVYFSESYFVISFLAAPASPLAVKKYKAGKNSKILLSISKLFLGCLPGPLCLGCPPGPLFLGCPAGPLSFLCLAEF